MGDYLVRDSYHAGTTEYGFIDTDRILNGFRVKGDNLVISLSAIDALFNSFDAIQYMYKAVYYHKTSRLFDCMLSDGFSKIPEFVEEIVSDLDTFLKYDDCSVLQEVKKRGKKDKNYGEAWEIFDDVLNRRKRYERIFDHWVGVRAGRHPEVQRRLDELKKDVENMAENLELRVDFRPEIRPIGIKPEEIIGWMEKIRTIYDPRDGKLRRIDEVSIPYYYKLNQFTTLFRIFANRYQIKKGGEYEKEMKRIIEICQQRITEIERWSLL